MVAECRPRNVWIRVATCASRTGRIGVAAIVRVIGDRHSISLRAVNGSVGGIWNALHLPRVSGARSHASHRASRVRVAVRNRSVLGNGNAIPLRAVAGLRNIIDNGSLTIFVAVDLADSRLKAAVGTCRDRARVWNACRLRVPRLSGASSPAAKNPIKKWTGLSLSRNENRCANSENQRRKNCLRAKHDFSLANGGFEYPLCSNFYPGDCAQGPAWSERRRLKLGQLAISAKKKKPKSEPIRKMWIRL